MVKREEVLGDEKLVASATRSGIEPLVSLDVNVRVTCPSGLVEIPSSETSRPIARRPFRVLCLDGGGYLGLATAAFLQGLERHFKRSVSEEFDLFVGTSTGGIIALALAYGMSGSDIVQLYRRLGDQVFCNKWPLQRQIRTLLPGLWRSRYGNAPLRAALEGVFQTATLADVLSRNKRVVVPAFNFTLGAPCVFKTDHAPNLSRDGGLRLVDIAMATSAAPTFLPMVTISMPDGSDQIFVDGGVFANNPALLGLAEARFSLGVAAEDLSILSVSTPKHRIYGRRPRFGLKRGLAAWSIPLADLFVGSSMDIGHQTARRLHVKGYDRVELRGSDTLTLDRTDQYATETLLAIGGAAANDNTRRATLAHFFEEGETHGQHPETA